MLLASMPPAPILNRMVRYLGPVREASGRRPEVFFWGGVSDKERIPKG
jgi:hypothetical protein